MPVRVTLDKVLRARGMTAKALAEQVDLSETQMSLFRSGKVRGMRFATLARLCHILQCKPADLLDYDDDAKDMEEPGPLPPREDAKAGEE